MAIFYPNNITGQNLSGITFNGNIANRNGDGGALNDIALPSDYQQGDTIILGTVYNNTYYVTSGITGDITNNNYSVTGVGQLFNVEDFGATRNGDGTSGIQRAINMAMSGSLRGSVYLPGNTYYISDTITIPEREGLRIMGQGISASDVITTGNEYLGSAARLVWTGPLDGRPMIDIKGFGIYMDGITLLGKSALSGTNCPVGLRFTRGASVGAGKCVFPQLAIQFCDVAIQLGTGLLEHNLDNINFGYVDINDCRTGIQMNNIQGLGIYFEYVHFANIWNVTQHSTFAEINAGGNLYVEGASFITPTTVLHIKGNSSGIGHNNSKYSVKNVKFDNAATTATGQFSRLLVTDNNVGPFVTFDDIDIAPSNYYELGYHLIEAKGNAKILLNNINKLQRNTIRLSAAPSSFGGASGYPNLTISNSRTFTGVSTIDQLMDTTNSSGQYYWSSRNSSNFYGVPFRDTGNYTL